MEILFVASVSVIAPDPVESRRLYVDALGLPLERLDCASENFMFKIVGFADDGRCAQGDLKTVGGYDRRVCGYGWYGGERLEYY